MSAVERTAFAPALWQARDDSAERGDTRRLAHIVQGVDAPAGAATAPADAPAGAPALLGFACDAGVRRNQGRVGAAGAPAAIRRALAGLPAHDMSRLYDAGDVVCLDDALEDAQDALAAAVAALLQQGLRPVVLGGGHEIAWGTFQGLHRWLGAAGRPGPVLVLNLDAHFDLRTGRPGSSGTPFDQIAEHCAAHGQPWRYACLGVSRLSNTAALYARAAEIGACWIEDVDLQERHLDARLAQLDTLLAEAAHVYLTIDIDVLPAGVAPGVSAPAPYGVPMAVIEALVQRVIASGKLRVADLAECNPALDLDHRTAKVAARLAWRLLAGAAA